ncbi:helix-turn-helix domain-containing protein [Paenibacillus chartarius]|uniref:Helix-turn-helix domain-containing protein n=1 Tax=Paenibacillus chartarius TaxID=747481 RepID=A0ABV6DUB7_9BACL
MELLDIHKELIQYENPFMSLKIFQAQREHEHATRWHYHKEIELLAVLEGRMDVFIEEGLVQLQEGGVALVGSSQLHRDRSYAEEKLDYLVLQFDLEQAIDPSTMPHYRFFSETRFPLSRLNDTLREQPETQRAVFDAIKDIYREWSAKRDGYELAISISVKRILLALLRSSAYRTIDLMENADLIRLKPVFDYVEVNLDGKISVEEASRAANVSYYYFVKFFKKTLGMTFMDYVNLKKIKRAEKLLLTRPISVAEVGEQIGMPNMAHFYKMFRKYNRCSPNEFRRRMQEWGPVER